MKFFNLRTSGMPETDPSLWDGNYEPDYLMEKMDGFLCTLYRWEGKEYLASKGSFHSPHAKWATATYNAWIDLGNKYSWPEGYTPVFEGITKNLRIVVDYGDREELVLTGLINIETGAELLGADFLYWAHLNNFSVPSLCERSLDTANKLSLDPSIKNFEGYVAVWDTRPGASPFRLKIKYLDYLRIHRMVCGVSPKAIYNALVEGWQPEMDEWLDESTPWFNKFRHEVVDAAKT